MMFPLVRDLAAETVPARRVPVAVTCRVLGFSKQAYYKWLANPVTDRDWDDAHLINAAIEDPPRRPGVRLPIHHRRTGSSRHRGEPQPREPALHATTPVVGSRP